MVFEKTLQDIVKGIRASKRDTALYISQCIAEIKTELNASDMYVKANALQKLTFLHMMGYSMSWASFATIEVMSSPRFAQKRIGYIAANQGFTQDTDVILLTTNLLKKELRGAVGGSMTGVYEAGLAVNCISNIVTTELAQDLLPELTNLTSHPQPYLRKKAVLCLFKVFVKYPQGLRLTFAKIQQCLSDSNPAVVSCAVNVITELSDKNPKNYLHLAPAFFDLLTSSSNNWMLIKVVKLLGSLVPEEPRLARKLLEPLADIVKTTPAKSLLYESAHAITKCLPYCRKSDGSMPASVPDIVALCAQTFRDFVEEKDQNLKYLGLVGFGSLMASHPKVLSAPGYRPLILTCLSDEDVTIRSRALDLLPSMATRKNLVELVSQLLRHVELASGTYKLELVAKVVEMCSGEKYALLQDFGWYLDILFQLGHVRGLEAHAELLRSQVSDVALRVLPIRPYAVKRSMEILLEGEDSNHNGNRNNDPVAAVDADNGRGKHIMPEILPGLAWIAGEYSDLMADAIAMNPDAVYIYNDDSEGPYHSVIQALTTPSNSNKLPPATQAVFLQASLKLFAAASANPQVSNAELEASVRTISHHLPVYMQSTNVEVRERSISLNGTLVALELTSQTGDAAPALSPLDDDEDDGEDDGDKVSAMEGDLLALGGSTPPAEKPENKNDADPLLSLSSVMADSGSTSSLAARCRNASATFNYLFKPSPMKPTGAKAQRKKHQAPIGVDIDLSAPADLTVFSQWIEEEKIQRSQSRLTLESVSFTQQRPLSVALPHRNIANDAVSSMDMPSSTSGGASNVGSFGATGDAESSFQNAGGGSTIPLNNIGGSRPQTANDPFYLNSSPGIFDAYEIGTTTNLANRFGTIQLGEDDDNDAEAAEGRSKKKKEKKHKKQPAHEPPAPVSMGGMGAGAGGFGTGVAMYGSDDEDDDHNDVRLRPSRRTGGRKAGKEFSGLAKVDLTMPLREDEVMPERKHRVVPERPSAESVPTPMDAAASSTKASKKKKKKESKRSKKAAKQQHADSAGNIGGVGDLLDLGLFGADSAPQQPLSTPSFPPAPTSHSSGFMATKGSAVNSAFDDLLGLSMDATTSSYPPAAATTLDLFGPSVGVSSVPGPTSSSGKSGKRPYLRATIKPSSATGSPTVDWEQVQLSYRVYRSQGPDGTPAAMIAVRADNTQMSALSGLVLRLKDYGDIAIGDVAAGSSSESSKVGPFSYASADAPLDMKGALVSSDCSVPVKLTLPVSVHLSPANSSMTMEMIASELSSRPWSVHSAKIPVVTEVAPEKIKSIVGGFLHLLEVEPSDPMYGTFAGQTSSTGTPVCVLLKVKKDSVKVDIKAGNAELGKALVSELKKLVL